MTLLQFLMNYRDDRRGEHLNVRQLNHHRKHYVCVMSDWLNTKLN